MISIDSPHPGSAHNCYCHDRFPVTGHYQCEHGPLRIFVRCGDPHHSLFFSPGPVRDETHGTFSGFIGACQPQLLESITVSLVCDSSRETVEQVSVPCRIRFDYPPLPSANDERMAIITAVCAHAGYTLGMTIDPRRHHHSSISMVTASLLAELSEHFGTTANAAEAFGDWISRTLVARTLNREDWDQGP